MSKSKLDGLRFDPEPETCCGDGDGCVLDCVWPPLQEDCLHDWLLRPESDTWVCLICGGER